MSYSARAIAEEIVTREGGFVDDRDDPGGATNFGVTIGTLKGLGFDVDHDGDVDITDVRELSKAQAVDIFLRHYFERPGIARLPVSLQASVFDMYVNSGANAAKILQRLLARIGFTCTADGVIGPQTILAAVKAEAKLGPAALADAYGAARRDYYYALADARPASRKYARRRNGGKGGWITRAEEFMSPSARLTEAQHQARCAAWA